MWQQAGNLVEVRSRLKEGLQVLLDAKDYWLVPYPLNGLADLAVREAGWSNFSVDSISAACIPGLKARGIRRREEF